MANQDSISLFEKHPKKSLFGLLVCLLALLYFIFFAKIFNNQFTEYEDRSLKTILLQYFFGKVIDNNVHRFIKLREHQPDLVKPTRPSRTYIKNIPGELERRYYDFKIEPNGFIAPSAIHENPDYQIVFLGGSTTECLYMDEDKRFPYVVGRLLEKSHNQKVNSYNGGVSANESMHSINILLNKVVAMQPDMVVMMHNINDLVMLRLNGTYFYQDSLKSHLQTAKNVFTRHEYVRVPDQVSEQMMVQAFTRNLQMFISICKINQIEPVLMTQANRVDNDPLYHTFNQIIRNVAVSEKVLLIDLANLMPNSLDLLLDSYHYTEKGSQQCAEIIAQQLGTKMEKNQS